MRISKYKNIFAKGYSSNWSKEGFFIKKVRNTVSWTYLIEDINGEEIIATFSKEELQKSNQKEFRTEKVINYALNGKVIIIHLTVGFIKKYCLIKMSYFLESFANKNKIEIELDLSDYATEPNLKNVIRIDISKFAKNMI